MSKGKGAAVAGAVILAVVIYIAPFVEDHEGTVERTYLDPAKIPTFCTGHTGPDVFIGRVAGPGECRKILEEDLRKHAEGVAQCTPEIFQNQQTAAAVVSFTFNVGISAYCKSSAARHFQAGNFRAGCERLGDWRSITVPRPRPGLKCVKKKGPGWLCELPGLVRRRQAEVRLCLSGLESSTSSEGNTSEHL